MHVPGRLQPKKEEILKSFSNLSEHRRCPEKPLSKSIYDKDTNLRNQKTQTDVNALF